MELPTIWFILIAFFWVGYLVLEGFDFGVGMLTVLLARTEKEKRVLLNTIGPVWDGNEVWLIVAAGATFAAFPDWYATMLTAFYLPIFLTLVALIGRIVGLDYRSKRNDATWRRRCDGAIVFGSVVPAVVWGVVLADLLGGLPIDAEGEFVGNLLDLLHPYALLGALVTVTVFCLHGATFTGLKTVGDIRTRARRFALRIGVPAWLVTAMFIAWTVADADQQAVTIAGFISLFGLAGCLVAVVAHREGWAFLATTIAIAAWVVMIFIALYPAVMVSSLNPQWDLTVSNAASSDYTLTIMTWTAAAFTPLVVGYQAWSYWVFRKRIGTKNIGGDASAAPTSEQA